VSTPPSNPPTPTPVASAPVGTAATTTVAGAAIAGAKVANAPHFGKGVLKLIVAGAIGAGTYWCVGARTEHFSQAEKAAAQEQQSSLSKSEPAQPLNVEKATPDMKATNDLLISWAVAVLGATLGIAMLAKGAKIKDGNWGLVLFPSAWVFLLASVGKGYEFKSSLTYQTAKGTLSFPDLNLPLYLQLEFFRSALIVLSAVGLWYLFFRFSLAEEGSKEGD
jgi:hypothetical protein